MPPELELVRQWVERAQADLRAATVLETDPSLTSEVCFHCQQAAEEALKAYLTFKGIEFEFVHSIVYLLDLATEEDRAFERFRNSAESLTQYAVRFRYPQSTAAPTPNDAKEALTVAQEVISFVIQRLPSQISPGI